MTDSRFAFVRLVLDFSNVKSASFVNYKSCVENLVCISCKAKWRGLEQRSNCIVSSYFTPIAS